MYVDTTNGSLGGTRRGVFAPLLLDNVGGLNDHVIKHLQHLNQLPPSVPRQGVSYLQAKSYWS
jgi:hypothetical protein